MNCPQSSITAKLFVLSAGIALFLTGCTSVNFNTQDDVPAPQGDFGAFVVEMHTHFGSPTSYDGRLTGATTISEALKVSGAMKKFKSMDVEVRRVVNKGGRATPLRLPVQYEYRTRSVPVEQDYALLDGDRVVVTPASSSNSILNTLSAFTGSG